MFEISCPWCGPRDESEFKCGGEAHIKRPGPPNAVTDDEWGDYVFMRKNPKGVHHERWVHIHGCRRWFHVARNTATDQILAVYKITDPIPDLSQHPGARGPATPSGEPRVGSGNRPIDEATPATGSTDPVAANAAE